MKTIINKETGEVLYCAFLDVFLAENEIVINELPTGTFYDFETNLNSNSAASGERTPYNAEVFLKLRNEDGSRKRYSENQYPQVEKKLKSLREQYGNLFEIIKVSGEKGDTRVYYAIRVKDNYLEIHSKSKGDPNIESKYFKTGLQTDSITILQDIIKQKNKFSPLAEKLLEYAKYNNVTISLVDSIPVTNGVYPVGIYYSNKHEKANTIEINRNGAFKGVGVEPTILHEILHSLTYSILRKDSDSRRDFEKLFQETKSKIKEQYAVTNVDEFLVGLFTDESFVKDLKNIEPISFGKLPS